MSVVVGSIVLVQVGNQRVKARVTEYLSNDNILVYSKNIDKKYYTYYCYLPDNRSYCTIG